jgi:hypothetical protein
MENWKNLEYKGYREFKTFLMSGRTQDFDSESRSYDQLKLIKLTRYDF